MPVSEFVCSIVDAAAVAVALRFRAGFFGALDWAATDRAGLYAAIRRGLRGFVSLFEAIHADMVVELAFASGNDDAFPLRNFLRV